MYGDEIGMGENLSLPGRVAVRGPMQWSPRHAGGFSPAAELHRPACADGPYGYRTVNVLDQRHQWAAGDTRARCGKF
jgi:maltose alpha-D-glucosyltransferase/alpha-amylase